MKKILVYISSIILFLIVLGFIFLKKDYQVIYAEFNHKNLQTYAPDCYIKFKNKSYLTTNRWIYKCNFLSKRIVPNGESILVEKFDFFDHRYSKNEEGFKFLHLKETKDFIKYNGKFYKIDYKNGDSLFSKINGNEILVFINSENLD
jgi:hypothetical protein